MEAARPDFRIVTKEVYLHSLCHVIDKALPREKGGQLTLVVDVRGGGGWGNPTPKQMLPFMKSVVSTMSAMYPERLRRVVVYPVPWAAKVFVNMVKGLLDPNTRSKLCIVSGDDKSSDCPGQKLSEHLTIHCFPQHAWSRNKSLE